jgi:hypothetical protein
MSTPIQNMMSTIIKQPGGAVGRRAPCRLKKEERKKESEISLLDILQTFAIQKW